MTASTFNINRQKPWWDLASKLCDFPLKFIIAEGGLIILQPEDFHTNSFAVLFNTEPWSSKKK